MQPLSPNKRSFIKSQIDPVLDKWTGRSKVPMVVCTAVTKSHGVVYLGASGVNSVEEPADKTTVDTVFDFYAVTKVVTTTAVLQLVEEGAIASIDDPAELYLPELQHVKVIDGFDAEERPILVAPRTKMTIRHLLTHTAGYSYPFQDAVYQKLQQQQQYPNDVSDGAYTTREKVTSYPLVFHPGEFWEPGFSTDVLGRIVVHLTGKLLEEYFQARIFQPLDIHNISFFKSDEHLRNYAKLHHRHSQGGPLRLADSKLCLPSHPDFQAGGMGLRGTVPEFARFLEIFLHRGTSPRTGAQILRPETLDRYSFANLFPHGRPVKVRPSQEALPQLALIDQAAVPNYLPAHTASFVQVPMPLPTGRSRGSYFWGGLANLVYWIDLDKEIVGFCATQVLPHNDKYANMCLRDFETAIYYVLGLSEENE